jgi:hypothetical protein
VADKPFTTRRLNRATLARQMLLERADVSPTVAIGRLAGLQAQLARPPFVGLWTRLAGFERAGLARALADRSVVRATMMRGTLHLVTAADYLALRSSLQASLTKGMQSILKARAAIDVAATVTRAKAWFREGPRTFDDVRDLFRAEGLGSDERALAYAVRLHLPLVQVPTDAEWGFASSADFALADVWLGAEIAKETALDELVLRYLAAFGPATAVDAQVWSGAAGLQSVFDALRSRLIVVNDERGRELFDLPDAPRPEEDLPAAVRYLPDFDNLVLSHADRTRVVPEAYRGRIVSKNLQVAATFLVDGFVAGTWRVESKKSAATLALRPFAGLSKKTRDELAAEGERLLAFVEPAVIKRVVRFEPVTKG